MIFPIVRRLALGALLMTGGGWLALAQSPSPATGGASALGLPASAAGALSEAGGGIRVGPLRLIPTLDLARGYDDNLYQRQTNVLGSAYVMTSPALRLESPPGQLRFDVTLRMDATRYDSAPADNTLSYGLTGNMEMTFTGRASMRLRAEHRHGSDPRGFTDRAISATPDEWDNTGAEGVFRYGAQGAQGRIEIDTAYYLRRYTNNRATTAAADRDTSQLGGTFYWRVRPKTELLLQTQFRRIDYVLPSVSLDSTEQRHYLGLKWEATAATTGIAKFGWLEKRFDAGSRNGISESSWDIGVRWSPRTYSVVDLVTSRQTGESSGLGDAIVGTNYGLTWSHAWSSRLRTQAIASYRNDQFTGAGISRQDNVSTLGGKVLYDFRRWLRFGVEYTHSERDSSAFGLDYRRNVILFTVGGTL